jgi:rare lipoprotein A (peptidoglycan hydrolase)
MNFRNILLAILFIFLSNCTAGNYSVNTQKDIFKKGFSNKGFALIYDQKLYKDSLISKKIDERSLVIFQKNLKINTPVKVTNILNNKSLIAKVGYESEYPPFYNSVLSKRIADELDLNINEPYVEILEIMNSSTFVAKKAKTYDEEKKVATKAPVNSINISDLNKANEKNKQSSNNKFSYIIKVADFYFNDTAKLMISRIASETEIKNPKIEKLSIEKFRVYLGPFNNINSLQKSFNSINILEFENIEIIKNE